MPAIQAQIDAARLALTEIETELVRLRAALKAAPGHALLSRDYINRALARRETVAELERLVVQQQSP